MNIHILIESLHADLALARQERDAALARAATLAGEVGELRANLDDERRAATASEMADGVTIRALSLVLRNVARMIPAEDLVVGYESGGSPWWARSPGDAPHTWHYTLAAALRAAGLHDAADAVEREATRLRDENSQCCDYSVAYHDLEARADAAGRTDETEQSTEEKG